MLGGAHLGAGRACLPPALSSRPCWTFQVSVPPGALDCWVFLSCLEVLQRIEGCCDRVQIDSNVAHTVGLWSYATEKVTAWTQACMLSGLCPWAGGRRTLSGGVWVAESSHGQCQSPLGGLVVGRPRMAPGQCHSSADTQRLPHLCRRRSAPGIGAGAGGGGSEKGDLGSVM